MTIIICRLRLVSLDHFVYETLKQFHHELYLHGIGEENRGLFTAYIRARWVSTGHGVEKLMLHTKMALLIYMLCE